MPSRYVTWSSSCRTLEDVYQATVTQIQRLTGYDRSMLCYFHEDQHGEVIAEKLGTQVGENESYLHTHFPATDTPQRTRSLFLLNRMRIIEDAYEQQSPLACSGACELTPQAVPLTKSTLRGIHQCHLDYLRTWGVRGTLVLSLPVNGKLWGIVVCHHIKETLFLSYRYALVHLAHVSWPAISCGSCFLSSNLIWLMFPCK